ncbi:energy transducer TonB family protein [Parerythrobacter aestuarii]|uniref:energy transducer TonB family protein n=1 Tax=Parerythrobacter aestuarii TaxID=3020909 RepID=UPI0024DE2FC7|nr:TonB family protein [Parerythrobacter aestuarii]
MKSLIHTAVALALGATTLTPAFANTAQEDIIVSPSRAMQAWRADVSRDLSRNLDLADRWGQYNSDSGIVQVRFTLDENGRPVDLETYRSSGSVSADRAAMWAVRRLSGLDEGPARIGKGTTFQANIIFAETRAEQEQLSEKLAWIERNRLALGSIERNVIALGQ